MLTLLLTNTFTSGGRPESKIYDSNELKNKNGDCGEAIANVPLSYKTKTEAVL